MNDSLHIPGQNCACRKLSTRFRLRTSRGTLVCSAFVRTMKKKVEFSSHTGNLALMRKFVRGFLEAFGCRCTVVENGVDAVRLLAAAHAYDLVLMDCQMPEMDGLEATRRVRAYESTHGAHVPIVALTANAMVGDREACLAAGMDDFLSKPFQRQEFSSMLDQWGWAPRVRVGSGHDH